MGCQALTDCKWHIFQGKSANCVEHHVARGTLTLFTMITLRNHGHGRKNYTTSSWLEYCISKTISVFHVYIHIYTHNFRQPSCSCSAQLLQHKLGSHALHTSISRICQMLLCDGSAVCRVAVANGVALIQLLVMGSFGLGGGRVRTTLQTSIVLETQFCGIPLPSSYRRPVVSFVLSPPCMSTLQARPGSCRVSPMRKTPFTASKLAPVSWRRASTTTVAPWEYPSRMRHSDASWPRILPTWLIN